MAGQAETFTRCRVTRINTPKQSGQNAHISPHLKLAARQTLAAPCWESCVRTAAALTVITLLRGDLVAGGQNNKGPCDKRKGRVPDTKGDAGKRRPTKRDTGPEKQAAKQKEKNLES